MNEQLVCKQLRNQFGKTGWQLLIYYGIMNICVTAVMFFQIISAIAASLLSGYPLSQQAIDRVIEDAAGSGLGYLLALAIGLIILVCWKKGAFCFQTIWKKDKSMTVGSFFAVFVLFFAAQAVAQIWTAVLELLLNQFGCSLDVLFDNTALQSDGVSAFLYASVFAPVCEEILFRGLVLRSLQPYGKKFAVLASAFLFGVFHGNIIQTPYAFLVGLVLGYVTVEYSMGWAVLLHLLNNMVLADFMTRLSELLPAGVGDLITLVFIWVCVIAAVSVCVVKRREIKAYLTQKKMHPWCMKSFFTAPGIVVYSAVLLGNLLLTTVMLFFV